MQPVGLGQLIFAWLNLQLDLNMCPVIAVLSRADRMMEDTERLAAEEVNNEA